MISVKPLEPLQFIVPHSSFIIPAMPELIVNFPDRSPEQLSLGRLRITIGRSARNDVCIPDPFASRVHAEVRREGDQYFLQDLGSANGTYYNGSKLDAVVPLAHGGRLKIGETAIVFRGMTSGQRPAAPPLYEGAPPPPGPNALRSRRPPKPGP